MLCALVRDNVVIQNGIQTLDEAGYQAASATCQIVIDITDILPQPQVGWTFDGNKLVSNGTYGAMIITKLAFRQRFTYPELIGIYNAVATNPMIRIMLDNQMAATFVDLARTDTQSGLGYLVSQGLLTVERMNTILNTPPAATEIYKG